MSLKKLIFEKMKYKYYELLQRVELGLGKDFLIPRAINMEKAVFKRLWPSFPEGGVGKLIQILQEPVIK